MTEPAAEPSLLFSPFKLRGVTFPNRIVVAPMQMYKTAPDGKLTDWHFQHLTKYAVGGAGTVMTEALCVDPIGRNTYGDAGIWSDEHIAPLRRGHGAASTVTGMASNALSTVPANRRASDDKENGVAIMASSDNAR